MSKIISIDAAMSDPKLLGAALGDPRSWAPWRAVVNAAFGLPLDAAQQQIFARVAGGRRPPTKRVRQLWAVAGRRAGKSRIAAMLAVYLAVFVKHRLAPGERGEVLILAMSMEQARAVFQFALAFLSSSPVLRQEIKSTTADELRLHNGIVIAIHSNSFRTVRGRTLVAAIFDEVAYWRDDTSVAPDTETYTAVLPALMTTKGMLVGISSPYRKRGLLFQKYCDHFGVDGDTLVVQGSSQTFNPLLDGDAIEALRQADPANARAEVDAEFRSELASFLDDALIDAAVEHGRPLELPPCQGVYYNCFVDPSGGRGSAYTMAIAHKEGERNVVDVVRGRHPPFDPQQVTKDYAALARNYKITEVEGDRYSAEWVRTSWQDCAIAYRVSPLDKGQIYLETLPLFTRGLVTLPNHTPLLRELRLLERSTARRGKDTIGPGHNGSDDYANAVCGALHSVAASRGYDTSYRWVNGPDDDDPDGTQAWHRLRLHTYIMSGGKVIL